MPEPFPTFCVPKHDKRKDIQDNS